MENSGKLSADSASEAEWYVVVGDRWLGPMSVPEVLEKISLGDLTWAHFAWRKGESGWKRICDLPDFQGAVPEKPTQVVQKQIKTASKAQIEPDSAADADVPRNWYLYYNDSQFGPFSIDELKRYLSVGKIHARVHAWRDGLEEWTRIEDLEEFKVALSKKPPGKPKAKKEDLRGAPRKPLVAKLFLTDAQEVVIAVCRDISVGGMQVLTDRVPGGAGTRVRMNVSPSGGTNPRIPPFVAEGVIVRVLEDGRGFSFRFDKLEDPARKSIENYIAIVEGART